MRSVGAYEAKTHLPRLLDEVAAGGSIAITKRGVPVAVLVPPEQASRPAPKEAVEALLRWQETHRPTLNGLALRAMVEEGRR